MLILWEEEEEDQILDAVKNALTSPIFYLKTKNGASLDFLAMII